MFACRPPSIDSAVRSTCVVSSAFDLILKNAARVVIPGAVERPLASAVVCRRSLDGAVSAAV